MKLILFTLALVAGSAFADSSQSVNPSLVSIGSEGGTVSSQYYLYVYDPTGKQVSKVLLDPSGDVVTASVLAVYNQKISEAKAAGQNLKITKLDGGLVSIFPDKDKKMEPLCSGGPAATGAAPTVATTMGDEPKSVSPYFTSIGTEGGSFLGFAKPYLYIYNQAGQRTDKIPIDPTGQIVNAKLLAAMNQRISEAKAKGQMLNITKGQYNGVVDIREDKAAKITALCPPAAGADGPQGYGQ